MRACYRARDAQYKTADRVELRSSEQPCADFEAELIEYDTKREATASSGASAAVDRRELEVAEKRLRSLTEVLAGQT